MICPAAMLDGLLLAAAARPASNLGASQRAETGLSPGLARVVRDRVQQLEALPTAERHLALRRAARQLMPAISGEALPARARALLATEVERELGRRWLAAAPAPRRGFRARPGLRATLARIGRQPQTAPREQKNLARGRGRQALVRARRLFPAEEACLRGLRVEPEEAVAVQTLEGLSPEQPAGPRPELLRILLRASSARPAQLDVSLALGRLLRGAEGGGGSGLERTGRELSEWVDATCPD